MQDNQRILKYNIDFNRLAIQTGWSDNVLRHWYYSGLAEQIKDVMGQQGKPANLPEMKTLAHAIDYTCHITMPKKLWASKDQQDWLYAQLPDFRITQEAKTTPSFFSKIIKNSMPSGQSLLQLLRKLLQMMEMKNRHRQSRKKPVKV